MIDQKQYFRNQVEVEYKILSLQPMKLINVKDMQKLIKWTNFPLEFRSICNK